MLPKTLGKFVQGRAEITARGVNVGFRKWVINVDVQSMIAPSVQDDGWREFDTRYDRCMVPYLPYLVSSAQGV